MKKLFFILLCSFLSLAAYPQDDMPVIISRILKELYAKSLDSQLLKSMLEYENMRPDGSWADIDYASTHATNWPPARHLERMQLMAVAFSKPNSIYAGNQDIYQKLVKGMQYWYTQNPKSSNWWHNDISAPQYIGRILLLTKSAKTPLPPDLQVALLAKMQEAQPPFTFTGANKLDIAIHNIYRALYTNNEKLMTTAVREAFQPINFTTEEGLQHDYSYLQHKEQLMISAYGLVFLTGEYRVAAWLAGTKYALQEEKRHMLNNFFFNTFARTLRGRYIDYNVEGRGVSRPNTLDKKSLAAKDDNALLNIIAIVSPEKERELKVLQQRISQSALPSYQVVPSHTYFWRGDYTLHTRPAYSFHVRTVSKRTIRTEAGNGENLLATVIPDGSVNLVRRGDEYYNIMPVWEWDKIPGVTARDYDTAVTLKKYWGEYGSTDFVGGVTDSVYGTTAYTQDYDDVQAKKGYFFFDKEVVCMGAGITSKAPQNITTTLNQSWSRGKVFINEKDKISEVKNNTAYNNINWLWHDSIAYFFLQPAAVHISNAVQSGSWTAINKNRKGEEKGKVFKAWVNHHANPASASYAYVVVPGVSVKDLPVYNYAAIKNLSNTAALQAVHHQELDIVQAIFYETGSLQAGDVKIQVEHPCILQIKDLTGRIQLSIAEPTGRYATLKVEVTTPQAGKKIIPVTLPQAPYAGSSVILNIQ